MKLFSQKIHLIVFAITINKSEIKSGKMVLKVKIEGEVTEVSDELKDNM
jgi:hypothetical protein